MKWTNSRTLETMIKAVNETIPVEELEYRYKADAFLVSQWDMMMFKLERYVSVERLETVQFQWPADWWQAFKDRWFPAWARDRWPIQYARGELTAEVFYPGFKLPRERFGEAFAQLTMHECPPVMGGGDGYDAVDTENPEATRAWFDVENDDEDD